MTAKPPRPASRSDASARPPIVLVADKLDPEGLDILRAAGFEVRVMTGLQPAEIAAAAGDVDAILVRSASKVTAEVIAAAPRLRAVGRAGIGVDTIDVAAASRHGVLVMNTPNANAVTTGELALAHLFALARRLPAADASMKGGAWEKGTLTGTEITGKTLAVIGLGKIGRVVAERALGLRMNVIAHDPFLQGASPVAGVQLVPLDEALAQADFVTLHVPKSKETAGLIGREALAKMKRGSFLINCARGGIVDEGALLAALESGQLAGAALDVFATEPLPADSPLRRAKNLVLTPHLGATSDEAQKRVSVEISQQMVDYLLAGEARGAVNAPALSPEALAVLRPWITLGRRCGLLLAQVASGPIARVHITYAGELAGGLGGAGTEAVRLAVLAGLLQPSLDGPVNLVNAPLLAAERGLKVLEEHALTGSEYTSLLRVDAFTAEGAGPDGREPDNSRLGAGYHLVAGTVFSGRPRLVLFDGFGVDFVPQGEMLLTRHRDAPGVLGLVATWLGQRGVNIGGLHMGTPEAGEPTALALYQISRELTAEEQADLQRLPHIERALGLSLEPT